MAEGALRESHVEIDIFADADPLRELDREIDQTLRRLQELDREIQNVNGSMNSLQNMNGPFQQSTVINNYYQQINNTTNNVNNLNDSTNDLRDTTDRYTDSLRRNRDGLRDTRIHTDDLSIAAQLMNRLMRDAFRDGRRGSLAMREALVRNRYAMFQLAEAGADYQGTNRDFMRDVIRLGDEHRRITDEMINDDIQYRTNLIRTAGVMANRTTQAQRISENYDRMRNPMYQVNQLGLRMADGLNRIAQQGAPAVAALRMLGPQASNKQLLNMTQMLTRGMMRFQMVALGAAIGSVLFYTALFKAAMGPDPAQVRDRQNQITQAYTDAFNNRVKEIQNFTGLFEKASLEPVKKIDLTKALESQVTAIKTWMDNLKGLTKKGVDEGLIKELQKMGPAAAMEVKALNQMTTPELNKYVALWKEKGALARTQATSELEKLKEETARKVAELGASLKPLGIEVEKFKKIWAEALGPFIDMVSGILAKVVSVGTALGQFFADMNEVNPIFSKIIFSIVSLVPILTLLLSPLAIGAGLITGFKVALFSLWGMIGPVITGLAAMSATVWIVAAAIPLLIAGFILAYNNLAWFRDGVNNAIAAIVNFVRPAIDAVVGFVIQKFSELQVWWATNGAMISQAASMVWNFIKTIVVGAVQVIWAIMQFVWPLVLAIITSVWENIKGVINGAIMVITGIIQFFSALLTGNWSAAWNALKQIVMGALLFIWNFIQLVLIGRFIAAFRGFMVAGRAIFAAGWNGIKALTLAVWNGLKSFLVGIFNGLRSSATSFANATRNVIQAAWNVIRSLSQGLFNFLRTGFQTVWNFIKTAATGILNAVKTAFTNMWNAVKNMMTSIKDTITNMWNGIMNFFRGIDLTSIGTNIMQGLANGIGGMANKIWEQVKGIADKIKKAFTGALGIHSPSRVFMDYGVNTVQGYNIGVEKETDNMKAVTLQMAQAASQDPYSYDRNPMVNTTNQGSNSSIVFSPQYNIDAANGADEKSLRKMIQETNDEMYERLLELYGVGVAY